MKESSIGSFLKNRDEIFAVSFWDTVIEENWALIQEFPLKELIDQLERTLILSVLSKFEGNQRKTAKFLRLKPTTLHEKMKRHNICQKNKEIQMKKVGLVGGIGPESSIEYYRLIIKRFQERLNTKNYPEIIINSIDMTEMLAYVFRNQLDSLVDFLAHKIKILEKAGVEYGAIASNTPHLVFDRLMEKVNIPLISIVEETCKIIAYKKMKKVGLIGTKSTMINGFYNRIASANAIEIVIPNPGEQDFIHTKYMTELVVNRISPETKLQMIQIVRELKRKESIEGLILGGTELPLVLSQSDFEDIEVLDTTKIHVESIVTKMIENDPAIKPIQ